MGGIGSAHRKAVDLERLVRTYGEYCCSNGRDTSSRAVKDMNSYYISPDVDLQLLHLLSACYIYSPFT